VFAALRGVLISFPSSSEQQCDLLLQRCRGLDTTEVVDDEGDLQKTVSVENSFRRGTVRNMDAVWRALEDLFVRLPKLLQDRTSWALDPDRAFPTTIRLTIRMVDPDLLHKRRPYVTKSKQTPLDGKTLVQGTIEQNQSIMLKTQVTPLLKQLLQAKDINITRMNIALTNFQDVAHPTTEGISGQISLAAAFERKRQNPFSATASQTNSQSSVKRSRLGVYSQCKTDDSPASGENQNCIERTSPKKRLGDASKTNSLAMSSGKRIHENISRPAKMKATRIDHFFYRK
jgi:hypothetical protein